MNKRIAFLPVALAVFAISAAAEDYRIDKGESEGTGFLGASDGDLTLGGGFGKGVTDRIFAHGEVAFVKGGSASFGGAKVSAHVLGFGGGLQYNFNNAFKGNPNLVPYAGGGLSLLRASVSSSFAGVSAGGSDSSLYLNFGGGLRYYVKPNWGVRPELMVFAGKGSFVRAAVGLFYQF